MKRLLVAATTLSLAACSAFSPFWPYTRTPAEHARDLDARCRTESEQAAAPVLSPAAIDSVEPEYAHVQSGPAGREARLVGSRIHVRPLPGLSAESLERTLECHEARVALGAVAPAVDDPYVLSDGWVAIAVDSEGDGFAVRVQADDFEEAEQALDRARRFAASRR